MTLYQVLIQSTFCGSREEWLDLADRLTAIGDNRTANAIKRGVARQQFRRQWYPDTVYLRFRGKTIDRILGLLAENHEES